MKTLGVGVRVWIGWVPAGDVEHGHTDSRLSTGTITAGPYGPGRITTYADGIPRMLKERAWNVQLDDGPVQGIVERILTPIDDDFLLPREEEQEAKA